VRQDDAAFAGAQALASNQKLPRYFPGYRTTARPQTTLPPQSSPISHIQQVAAEAAVFVQPSSGDHAMATRERRLAEFDGQGDPPPELAAQVLCEDHSGTYQLPFLCRFIDGEWRNANTGIAVEARVVGWRPPRTM
jgi:hypothetical protein